MVCISFTIRSFTPNSILWRHATDSIFRPLLLSFVGEASALIPWSLCLYHTWSTLDRHLIVTPTWFLLMVSWSTRGRYWTDWHFLFGSVCRVSTDSRINCHNDDSLITDQCCFCRAGISIAIMYLVNVNLAFRYAGILMGITNTIATIPGFVAPIVVQELTGENVSRPVEKLCGTVFVIDAACD